jgi:hypothetical protein
VPAQLGEIGEKMSCRGSAPTDNDIPLPKKPHYSISAHGLSSEDREILESYFELIGWRLTPWPPAAATGADDVKMLFVQHGHQDAIVDAIIFSRCDYLVFVGKADNMPHLDQLNSRFLWLECPINISALELLVEQSYSL